MRGGRLVLETEVVKKAELCEGDDFIHVLEFSNFNICDV